MSDVVRHTDERRENRQFERYIKRVGRIMPALATRIFALRHQFYMGCGFHWSMERSLGLLIARVNDFENANLWHGKEKHATRSVIRVSARMLFEQVAAAERSVWPDKVKTTRDLRAARRRAERV